MSFNVSQKQSFGMRDTTYGLLSVSVLMLLTGGYGNVRLMQYAKLRKTNSKNIPNSIFFYLSCSNVIACICGIPIHIAKLSFDYRENMDMSSHLCLLRYIITMVTIDLSLISLTAMIIVRKDKIVMEPYGKKSLIHFDNINILKVVSLLLSTIPSGIMFCLYYYLLKKNGMLPCQKRTNVSTVHMILSIIESIKSASIAIPCITLIVRSINQLRNTLKLRSDRTTRMKKCIKKVTATFCYAGAFLIFWIPFGVMTLSSGEISGKFYNTWFNIGYTLCYGYLVGLPIICALTDAHFKPTKLSDTMPAMSSVGT